MTDAWWAATAFTTQDTEGTENDGALFRKGGAGDRNVRRAPFDSLPSAVLCVLCALCGESS